MGTTDALSLIYLQAGLPPASSQVCPWMVSSGSLDRLLTWLADESYRDQPAAAPMSPAPAVGCLPVPKPLSERRRKPEAFIQEPGSDSQPLVIGRTLKQIEMWEIVLELCAHEHLRLHMPKDTKLDPLKLNSLKGGAHRHWGALACVCACTLPVEHPLLWIARHRGHSSSTCLFSFLFFPKVKDIYSKIKNVQGA